jgi:adenylosuccinate synthase
VEPFDLEDVAGRYAEYALRLQPYIADTSLLVDEALRAGKKVLFEGAQGTLLDLDHGTYPFVTSSNPVASGAATGIGIGPNRLEEIVGVAKAYVTRVGEARSRARSPRRSRAGARARREFGTVTGRERRCGWLDLVALRYAVRLKGITSLALTKLDVLSALPRSPSACATCSGRQRDDALPRAPVGLPPLPAGLRDARTAGAAARGELPDAARAYVEFVERELEPPRAPPSAQARDAKPCSRAR